MPPTPPVPQISEQEDPELDFTDFMEKHKAKLQATAPAPEQKSSSTLNKPMSPIMIRGIIFFVVLLALLGVLIFLFLNRQQGANLTAPDGYRIIQTPGSPPKLQKL